MPTIHDIIGAIESIAPLSLQESWDNTGLLVGGAKTDRQCTGVMLCVDVTPQIVKQAAECGCNLIISHHPIIFKGLKHISGMGRVEESIVMAIRSDIDIYCCHTSIDKAVSRGVSHRMAQMLGLNDIEVLSPDDACPGAGLGAIGNTSTPMSAQQLVDNVKHAFGLPVARCSTPPPEPITRVALCGGSGGEFIPRAVAVGAQAYINSDTRYHDFSDWGERIFIVDIGHFESEQCTKQIFSEIIREKFPNFAHCYFADEKNPISYL
ncbi:MAG: Nif3-like dinuclear metal center hexameric protein [Muribaculaceae bacterium]|nr:Nif3-like dinuclear metal center hexameric protein [Muribaculaceae bacterium]MDE6321014.1 Nif3-like dinuclear metal center hexameric protein [Muribaculaceae bacterium]